MLLKTTVKNLRSLCTVVKKRNLFNRLHDLFHTLYWVMHNEEKIELKILRCSTLNFALMVNLSKGCRGKKNKLLL